MTVGGQVELGGQAQIVEQHWLEVLQTDPDPLQVAAWAAEGAVIEATSGKAMAAPNPSRRTASRRDIWELSCPQSTGFSSKRSREN